MGGPLSPVAGDEGCSRIAAIAAASLTAGLAGRGVAGRGGSATSAIPPWTATLAPPGECHTSDMLATLFREQEEQDRKREQQQQQRERQRQQQEALLGARFVQGNFGLGGDDNGTSAAAFWQPPGDVSGATLPFNINRLALSSSSRPASAPVFGQSLLHFIPHDGAIAAADNADGGGGGRLEYDQYGCVAALPAFLFSAVAPPPVGVARAAVDHAMVLPGGGEQQWSPNAAAREPLPRAAAAAATANRRPSRARTAAAQQHGSPSKQQQQQQQQQPQQQQLPILPKRISRSGPHFAVATAVSAFFAGPAGTVGCGGLGGGGDSADGSGGSADGAGADADAMDVDKSSEAVDSGDDGDDDGGCAAAAAGNGRQGGRRDRPTTLPVDVDNKIPAATLSSAAAAAACAAAASRTKSICAAVDEALAAAAALAAPPGYGGAAGTAAAPRLARFCVPSEFVKTESLASGDALGFLGTVAEELTAAAADGSDPAAATTDTSGGAGAGEGEELQVLAARFRRRPGRVPRALAKLGPIADLAKSAAFGKVQLGRDQLRELVVTVESGLAAAETEQKEDNRTRNRQAQQRFRSRQKDAIHALQARVDEQEELIAQLKERIRGHESLKRQQEQEQEPPLGMLMGMGRAASVGQEAMLQQQQQQQYAMITAAVGQPWAGGAGAAAAGEAAGAGALRNVRAASN